MMFVTGVGALDVARIGGALLVLFVVAELLGHGLGPRLGLEPATAFIACAVGSLTLIGTAVALVSGVGHPELGWLVAPLLVVFGALLPRQHPTPCDRPDDHFLRILVTMLLARALLLPWFSDLRQFVLVGAVALALFAPAVRRRCGVVTVALGVGLIVLSLSDGVALGSLDSPLLSNDIFFDEGQTVGFLVSGGARDIYAVGGEIGYHRLPYAVGAALSLITRPEPFAIIAGALPALSVLMVAYLVLSFASEMYVRNLVIPSLVLLSAFPVQPLWLFDFPKPGNVLAIVVVLVLVQLSRRQPDAAPPVGMIGFEALLVFAVVGTKLHAALVWLVFRIVLLCRLRSWSAIRRQLWEIALVGVSATVSFLLWFRSPRRLLTWSEGDGSTFIRLTWRDITSGVLNEQSLGYLLRIMPLLMIAWIAVRRSPSTVQRSAGLLTFVAATLAFVAGEPSKFASAAIASAAIASFAVSANIGGGQRVGVRLMLPAAMALGGLLWALAFDLVKWSFPEGGWRNRIYGVVRSDSLSGVTFLVAALGVVWTLQTFSGRDVRWGKRIRSEDFHRSLAILATVLLLAQAGAWAAKTQRSLVTDYRYDIGSSTEIRKDLVPIAQFLRNSTEDSIILGTNRFCHAPRRSAECVSVGTSGQVGALTRRRMFVEAPTLRSSSESLDLRERLDISLRFALFADPLAARELWAAGVTLFVVDLARTDRTSWEPVGRTIMRTGDFALVEIRTPTD
jgi:hypothetical protein